MNKNIIKVFSLIILLILMLGAISMGSPIPTEIKSVVTFVFVTDKEGELIPNGTSFFVGVKKPTNTNNFVVYLVTAKHVLLKPNTTEYYDTVFIRLNKKEGGSDTGGIPIKINGENQNVFIHTDSSVDLAVIPFLPDQSKYEFKFIPDDLITTKETYKELNIREGTDVFFAGLFSQYIGAEKNYPIVRFGRVALTTDEKISWQGKLMDLYLIEIGSYGGNSGSPVFFYLGSDREPGSLIVGSPILKLAGIMQGTFLDAQEIKVVETKQIPLSLSNMGIAAIVPAYKLYEILHSSEIKKNRGF
ncbi:MAG: hypothetical protein ABII25_08480 [bacterium]